MFLGVRQVFTFTKVCFGLNSNVVSSVFRIFYDVLIFFIFGLWFSWISSAWTSNEKLLWSPKSILDLSVSNIGLSYIVLGLPKVFLFYLFLSLKNPLNLIYFFEDCDGEMILGWFYVWSDRLCWCY